MSKPYLTNQKRIFPTTVSGFNPLKAISQTSGGTATPEPSEKQIRLEKPGETRLVVQRLIDYLKGL